MIPNNYVKVGNVIWLAAIVVYYIHAYSYNTIDLSQYRDRMAFPASNAFMKYMYANSFFLFIGSVVAFVVGVALATINVASVPFAVSWLVLGCILLVGAILLLRLGTIGRWRKRVQ